MDVFKGKKRDIGSPKTKAGLAMKSLGRRIRGVPEVHELGERVTSYIDGFGPKKGIIGLEITYNRASFH